MLDALQRMPHRSRKTSEQPSNMPAEPSSPRRSRSSTQNLEKRKDIGQEE